MVKLLFFLVLSFSSFFPMDVGSISTPCPKVAEGNSSLSVQSLGAEGLGGSTRADHENTISIPHTQGKTSTLGPYKGIWRNKGKWVSEIRIPKSKEKIWLGSYESAEKAAQAYDEALNNMRLAQLSGAKSADEIKRFVRGHASVGTSGIRANKRSKLSSEAELVAKDSTCLDSTNAHKIVFEPAVATGMMEVKACLPDSNLATDTSEVEAYIPTFAPEEPPEIPLADLPFDEEFIKGSDDWILDFMAERTDD